MKANEWLLNQNFIENSDYEDKYYLSSLGVYVTNYIRDIPVPILTTYKDKSIGFFIGSECKFFKLDKDIYYKDYIILVNRWVSKFFPYYEVFYVEERDLPDEEILNLVQKGMDLNDALSLKQKELKTERGVIEKITLKKDEFVLNINGNRSWRMSGILNNPLSLSSFLEELRKIEDNKERKKFIFDNSIFIKDIENYTKEVLITYQGKQMLNFFKINYEDNKYNPLNKIENFLYSWGRYKIKFESESLKNDCLKFYEEEILKDNIKFDSKKIIIKRKYKSTEEENDNFKLSE